MLDTRAARPGKPTPDFPLFAHGNGQWAKKSKGKLRYYGPWANPDAALGKYRAEKAQQPVSVTASSAPAKPKKPHPDYPLYAHRSGQWAKKVRGRTRFFGKWADPEAALQKWVAEKDAPALPRAETYRADRRSDHPRLGKRLPDSQAGTGCHRGTQETPRSWATDRFATE